MPTIGDLMRQRDRLRVIIKAGGSTPDRLDELRRIEREIRDLKRQ